MRSALSVHAERGSVAVLDASKFDTPSTKSAAQALAKWGAKSPSSDPHRRGDGRDEELPQHPRITVVEVGATGVADVIGAASIIISESSLKVSRSAWSGPKRGRAA